MTSTFRFKTVSGPAAMPVLGWRGNVVRFLQDPIGYMAPLPRAHGDVVPFAGDGAGPVVIREARAGAVFAFGPACSQQVWSQMAVFHSARVPGPPESRSFERVTAGLFNMNEDRHRQQRRLIQPAFHKARIEGYRDTMVSLTEGAIESWRPGETRDLVAEMERLTLAVANKTLFGLDTTAGELSLGEQIQEMLGLTMNPATLVPVSLPFTPRGRLVAAAARTEERLRTLIERKRAAGTEGDDVLSMLLASRDERGEAMSDDELVGQLFLLFFAGHDTTKNAVAWTVFLLSQHPRILADLRDELRGVLGGAAPRNDQIAELPLLDRVIKESLRLLPPAPFTGRITTRPTELGGVEIPAGMEVMVSPYCLHRYPDLYPEPQRFRPDRWEKLSPSPYEYAPFGAGPRMCIGAAFATLELKVVLAMLLQRFGFELAPGARIDRRTTVVMSPRHGMPMILRPREGTVPPVGRVRGDIHEMVDLPAIG
jgi:cytochrome P450